MCIVLVIRFLGRLLYIIIIIVGVRLNKLTCIYLYVNVMFIDNV